jgi:hypothetical protein
MEELKSCPNCRSNNLTDCYIYIRCNDCGMTGPKMNNGNMDEHADYIDRINAIKAWNKLPR